MDSRERYQRKFRAYQNPGVDEALFNDNGWVGESRVLQHAERPGWWKRFVWYLMQKLGL
jgi:hypothetical protein